MYNSSRIKVKTLKDSEVIIHGRDGYINSNRFYQAHIRINNLKKFWKLIWVRE